MKKFLPTVLRLLIGLIFIGSPSRADVPETAVLVYDFGPFNCFYQALMREYRLVADPSLRRIVRFQKVKAEIIGFRHIQFVFPDQIIDHSLSRNLEQNALLKMLVSGYINRELFERVLGAKDIWKASQMRFAITVSDLSFSEALRLFDGKIPWRRVLGAVPPAGDLTRDDWIPTNFFDLIDKPLRVMRAAEMMGVGQRVNPLTGRLEYFDMAWQKVDKFAHLAKLNRNIFPFTAEFSRANRDAPVLPGKLTTPLQILLNILAAEARLMGIPRDKVAIFARAIQSDRAKHMLSLGMYPYDEKLKLLFEQRPEDGFDILFKTQQPAEVPPESIMATNLTKVSEILEIDDVSQQDREISARSGGRLNLTAARQVRERFQSSMWQYLCFPEYPAQDAPICLWDMSILSVAFVADILVANGMSLDEGGPVIVAMTEHPKETPNFFTEYWRDEGMVLPHPGRQAARLRIDNISEVAVRKYGKKFLATVLLASRKAHQVRIQKAGQVVRSTLASILESNIGGHSGTVSADDFAKFVPITIVTSSRWLADLLKQMGGNIEVGDSIKFRATHTSTSVNLFVAQDEGYLVGFPVPVLENIRREFIDLHIEPDCPGYLKVWAPLLFAGDL